MYVTSVCSVCRLLNAHALYSYTGVNILLVEYRGYGKSTGSPGENGKYVVKHVSCSTGVRSISCLPFTGDELQQVDSWTSLTVKSNM